MNRDHGCSIIIPFPRTVPKMAGIDAGAGEADTPRLLLMRRFTTSVPAQGKCFSVALVLLIYRISPDD